MISTLENVGGNGQQERPQILWTPEKLVRFRQALEQAVKSGKTGSFDSFLFEGNEFVTAYAAYLIRFLETKFK